MSTGVNFMLSFLKGERWRLGMFLTQFESYVNFRADRPHKSGWRTLCALYTLSILVVSIAISEKRKSAVLKGALTSAETATVANDLILNCLETLDPTFLSLLGVATGRL